MRCLNAVLDHLVLFPFLTPLSEQEGSKEEEKKKNIHYWKENKVCTSLMTVSIERQSARLWSSKSLHSPRILWVYEVLPSEAEQLRSAVGQQAPPEGPHRGTSGASHTLIKYHSEYLAGVKKNAHRSSLFNYSITRMETVITWKPRTSPKEAPSVIRSQMVESRS